MLTGERGRTKQVTGEVRPHCGKISKKRTSGVWHSGLNAILLRQTLSRRASGFQEDQSWAILPSIRGGWAIYLGNVGFPYDHGRASVHSDEGKLFVLDDKCRHRGGPLHLCYRDEAGVDRCPWHDRKVLKRESHSGASAVYIVSRSEVTVVSTTKGRGWPVQVLER